MFIVSWNYFPSFISQHVPANTHYIFVKTKAVTLYLWLFWLPSNEVSVFDPNRPSWATKSGRFLRTDERPFIRVFRSCQIENLCQRSYRGLIPCNRHWKQLAWVRLMAEARRGEAKNSFDSSDSTNAQTRLCPGLCSSPTQSGRCACWTSCVHLSTSKNAQRSIGMQGLRYR